ncbi:hypothetical protein HanRHA438_Chr00c36g0856171 [Helianthus annuus]|nr:hypothetical protein HanXRQr2_Chr11g0487101 [Helianthus annuus]KAJ0874857.1 hypothetical protein HanPSC8_Chr11g0469291 [Helianthus annuus]KAJ0953942.1 hypothetical protein HanRHA438_Chr00c36g0856171 [Helianthus annuus]
MEITRNKYGFNANMHPWWFTVNEILQVLRGFACKVYDCPFFL